MFATGPRAVGFTIVWPEGVIFGSIMTYHVQILLLVRQPLFDRAALLLTQTSWVLPPLCVGKMTLRLYGALNYSHGLSKGPSFGTGRGARDAGYATEFVRDLESRLANRVQLTSDGNRLYIQAIEDAFGSGIDYAMLVKHYGGDAEGHRRYSPAVCSGASKRPVSGNPDSKHISTSYVERHNLSIRMRNRRFTRLTNAFSKKFDNHLYALALYFVHYNFCRIHKTLSVTPAMQAGLAKTLYDAEWIVGLVDAAAPKPAKPGPKPGSKRKR